MCTIKYVYIVYVIRLERGVESMSNEATTFAKRLLKHSFEQNASDIHFYPLPNSEVVAIFYRQLGKRNYIRDITKSFYKMMVTYFKFSANMDIGDTRRPQNGMITWKTKDSVYQLRLSTLPVDYSESLTIRILPQNKVPRLQELFLFPFQYKRIKRWLDYESGIILFTGPTGSGKTTTMYSLLEEIIEQRASQVITLEEPIERKVDHALQVEVNERAGITYQSGLKAALRHDPDVILIGEIRDEETATFTLRASLTGHLVLTTLHAKNAFGTIERLLDLNMNQVDLQQSLIGIAALRLIPIISKGKITRRAAIVELLDGPLLEKVIIGELTTDEHFHTFQYLKRKALRYGYICEKAFEQTT